jgi:hypothetical protein
MKCRNPPKFRRLPRGRQSHDRGLAERFIASAGHAAQTIHQSATKTDRSDAGSLTVNKRFRPIHESQLNRWRKGSARVARPRTGFGQFPPIAMSDTQSFERLLRSKKRTSRSKPRAFSPSQSGRLRRISGDAFDGGRPKHSLVAKCPP